MVFIYNNPFGQDLISEAINYFMYGFDLYLDKKNS
jgi:hypothetical protein